MAFSLVLVLIFTNLKDKLLICLPLILRFQLFFVLFYNKRTTYKKKTRFLLYEILKSMNIKIDFTAFIDIRNKTHRIHVCKLQNA